MSNNFEGGYEDSYQKRERLCEEFRIATEDLQAFFNVPKKDSQNAKECLNFIRGKMDKASELQKESSILEVELAQKNKEFNNLTQQEVDIDKKIEDCGRIIDEIGLLNEKIFEIEAVIENLMEEIEEIYAEQVGLVGDLESSTAAMNMKLKRVEDLKKEIQNLEDEQGF